LLRTKPETIVSHLIGHEGKGSLRSYLTEKGWANGIDSAIGSELSDLWLFEVSIELTELGFKNRDKVAEAVFAYIKLLSEGRGRGSGNGGEGEGEVNGGGSINSINIPDYIFEEIRQLGKISFEYSEKIEPADYVSGIANDMQHFRAPSQYLTGARLFGLYSSKATVSDGNGAQKNQKNDKNDMLIKLGGARADSRQEVSRFLSQLQASQCRVTVISKDFQGKTRHSAPYYGTPFNNITSTDASFQKKRSVWANASPRKYVNYARVMMYV